MISVRVSKVVDQLGGKRVFGTRPSSYESLRKAVERGLPRQSVQATLMILPNDDRELLESKLGAATTADLLDPIQSERLERIARVMAQTRETFGNDDAGIVSFLTTPNRNLGNERPIRRALTDLGARQVEDLLVKIAYGFPS